MMSSRRVRRREKSNWMRKKSRILVHPKWIEEAIAVQEAGGCEFHMHEDGSGKFCRGCGCCHLAKAYLAWKKRQKRS